MTTPIASEPELPALKPCPFCNRDSDLRVGEWLRGKWFVSCNGCDADGPMGRKREEAVAAWNRRTALSSRSGSAAETAGSGEMCQPDGLKFDAFGEPRTRYVRVTLHGSHLVMDPSEGDRYVQDARDAGDESEYVVRDVYLSEREFDDLGEFDGF